MAVSSTLGNVYQYTGSLAALGLGTVLNASVVNTGSGPLSATIIDDNGTLTQADDGASTASISGGAAQPIDYIGAGTASVTTLVGLELFAVPVMAFSAGGSTYLHFPDGLPPLSGLLISFNVNGANNFALPNPMPICLAGGTMVLTDQGEVPVEKLQVGDMIRTLDHGFQPLRWIGRRPVCVAEQQIEPRVRAVRIRAGALGAGMPRRHLHVTQQHRVMLYRDRGREALVPARMLVGWPGVELAQQVRFLVWYHLLFDRHEVLITEGCGTESLLLGEQAMAAIAPAARSELDLMFPEGSGARAPARELITRRTLHSDPGWKAPKLSS